MSTVQRCRTGSAGRPRCRARSCRQHRCGEAAVDELELVGFGVDVHEIDQVDAGNHAVGVAAVLAVHQFNTLAVVLRASCRQTRRSPAPALGFAKLAHVVVREAPQVVGQVRADVIHLATH